MMEQIVPAGSPWEHLHSQRNGVSPSSPILLTMSNLSDNFPVSEAGGSGGILLVENVGFWLAWERQERWDKQKLLCNQQGEGKTPQVSPHSPALGRKRDFSPWSHQERATRCVLWFQRLQCFLFLNISMQWLMGIDRTLLPTAASPPWLLLCLFPQLMWPFLISGSVLESYHLILFFFWEQKRVGTPRKWEVIASCFTPPPGVLHLSSLQNEGGKHNKNLFGTAKENLSTWPP